QTRPSVVVAQPASALCRTGLHISSTCTARSRCLPNQSSIWRAGIEDKLPDPALSTVAAISLWRSGFVHAGAINHKASHRIIALRCDFIIVSANLDRMFAHLRLPEHT